MKIRQGFVSNSSSTSFCIVGTVLEKIDCNENFITGIAHSNNIDWHYIDNSYEGIYAGLNIEKLEDDETLNEFKLKVQKKLKEFGVKVSLEEISIYYGGWFDG